MGFQFEDVLLKKYLKKPLVTLRRGNCCLPFDKKLCFSLNYYILTAVYESNFAVTGTVSIPDEALESKVHDLDYRPLFPRSLRRQSRCFIADKILWWKPRRAICNEQPQWIWLTLPYRLIGFRFTSDSFVLIISDRVMWEPHWKVLSISPRV